MKRRQIQFETDSDRDREIEKEFSLYCLKAAGVLLLALVLLILIGLTGVHGEAIDVYCKNFWK